MPLLLLLGEWPTPCGYAARANSDGAKLSFAFVFCKLEYMSILFLPHHKHTISCSRCVYGGAARYCPAVHTFVINAYKLYITTYPKSCKWPATIFFECAIINTPPFSSYAIHLYFFFTIVNVELDEGIVENFH